MLVVIVVVVVVVAAASFEAVNLKYGIDKNKYLKV